MSRSNARRYSQITGRDREVLEHVARYRLSTTRALGRAVLPNVSLNAVGKIANRLCAAGLLAKYPLVHPTQYFVLGRDGAKALGLGAHRTAPLGPQSLPLEYAVLVHAILAKQPRCRLTPRELRDLWPWLPTTLAAAPHCIDSGEQVIELIRVDLGGPADHVARRAVRDVNCRRRLHEFLPVVTQGRFRLVLVTAAKSKAQAIRAALEHHDLPNGLQLHFAVVSQLLCLTMRTPHA